MHTCSDARMYSTCMHAIGVWCLKEATVEWSTGKALVKRRAKDAQGSGLKGRRLAAIPQPLSGSSSHPPIRGN